MLWLAKTIDFIKKLFTRKKDLNIMDQQTKPETGSTAQKRKHKFEIQVYEADYEHADSNNGQPRWRIVRTDPALDGGRPNIIEVADKAELDTIQRQYALCEQRIKIIREIDPFTDDNPGNADASLQQDQSIPQNNKAIPIDGKQQQAHQQTQGTIENYSSCAVRTPTAKAVPEHTATQKAKPKIVMIGDVEVKYDGEKVYQKQWVKLTSSEASNFRVVNDNSNKIVALAGKHIEAKRWVLVEESQENGNDANVESLIEG